MPSGRVERANPSYFLMSGGSWRRGGGTIYAAFILPPEYAGFEGCTALGWAYYALFPAVRLWRFWAAVCGGWVAGVFAPLRGI